MKIRIEAGAHEAEKAQRVAEHIHKGALDFHEMEMPESAPVMQSLRARAEAIYAEEMAGLEEDVQRILSSDFGLLKSLSPSEFPKDHLVGTRVPRGGSSCANCKFLHGTDECSNKYWQKWSGETKLPEAADEYCCDFWE